MKLYRMRFLMLLLLISAASCSKESSLSFKERGTLIESGQVASVPKNQISAYVTEISAVDIAAYDVTCYYLTYRTEYQGKAIESKGLLLVPDGVDSIHLVTYFHGTQVPLKLAGIEKQTPSLYKGEKEGFLEVRNMGLSWASAGYTVFIPDYIGYGITLDKEHPYLYFPEMFKSNIDGLLAAKEFLAGKGFPADNRLFITGWSQGAGACLSAHKYIQESYADKFTVVASSGLAGPYNFSGFLDDVLKRKDEEVNILGICSWGIYAINKFSDLKRPTDQLWTYPVYDQMSALNTPSNIPGKVFNNYFLKGIIHSTDAGMREVIQKNSFHANWHPVGKVFLHHGDADDVVPYFNSVDAYDGLSAQGGDIKLYTYNGGNHATELDHYILNTLNDFNALK